MTFKISYTTDLATENVYKVFLITLLLIFLWNYKKQQLPRNVLSKKGFEKNCKFRAQANGYNYNQLKWHN